jgi:hypothetical protein
MLFVHVQTTHTQQLTPLPRIHQDRHSPVSNRKYKLISMPQLNSIFNGTDIKTNILWDMRNAYKILIRKYEGMKAHEGKY